MAIATLAPPRVALVGSPYACSVIKSTSYVCWNHPADEEPLHPGRLLARRHTIAITRTAPRIPAATVYRTIAWS
jgi:hypothetical protein